MAGTDVYANAQQQAFAKNINLGSDTLKMGLLNGYTPSLASDTHWADIVANEISGTGYTAGGVTLSSPSFTLTAANSWSHSWASATIYSAGQVIRPTTGNGFLYRAATAGTSGGTQPTFPTVIGETVLDNSAINWTCAGYAISVFTTATASWSAATFTAGEAVIYDAQTGVSTTEPLICVDVFSSAQSPSSQTFTVSPDSILGWFAVLHA